MSRTSLSIVIPSYNEARRLPGTLAAIAEYFLLHPRPVEVIVVDDGSTDGTAQTPFPVAGIETITWTCLCNEGNRGKGYSVRRGMLAARSERRLFTDADLSAPISELPKLEQALDAGADIAIGSRRNHSLIRREQSWFRRNSGRVFNKMVRISLGLPFVDTQCGFKLFTRASAEALFQAQRVEGWGFDPELLFLARCQGFRAEEIPVIWAHADGAKIHMFSDSLRMARDVWRIRRAHRSHPLRPARGGSTGQPAPDKAPSHLND